MPRKYKYRPGETVVITADIAKQQASKGPQHGDIIPYVEPEYPGRRIPGGINIWDLAMVSLGPLYHQWEMLDFQPSIPGSFENSTAASDDTYHTELLDKLFEVPVENWRTHYKRIVPEMNYKIVVEGRNDSSGAIGAMEELNDSNPNFTNTGLKADPQWFTPGYFPAINYSDGASLVTFGLTMLGESVLNHITTEYDINAPAADFTPSKKMDVFMVPSLPQMRGRLAYWDSGVLHNQQLNDFFYLYDRGIFLTPSNPLYPLRGVGFQFLTSAGLGTVYDSTGFAKWAAVVDWMKGFVGARARYSTDLGATWPTSDDGTNFGAIVPDPYPNFPPSGVTDPVANTSALLAGNNPAFLGNPANQIRLRCVIYQGGQYYYVWNVAYT